MLEDGHRALKRWERARQLEGLRQEAESTGPLAWCRIRAEVALDRIPVRLLALFEGDFAYVRAAGEAAPPGVPGPAWLTRGAIDWEAYLPLIIRQYGMARNVPGAFAPIRKLPRELLDMLGNLPNNALPAVFAKLRSEGLLPALPALNRGTCPPGLPWEDLRARFQDFKDSPPR